MLFYLFLALLLVENSAADAIQNFTVTTIVATPFTEWSYDGQELLGFIPDLMEQLSERLGFSYVFKIVDDNKYGSPTIDGGFDGMIGEVERGEADIAAADLSITPEREDAVDFTHPVLMYGVTGLLKRPTEREVHILTLQDLYESDDMQFGVIEGGSTLAFFRDSSEPIIQRLYEKLMANPSWMVSSLWGGIQRARNGDNYVFFTQSFTIDYITERDCSMMTFGWLLQGSLAGSGLAMRQGHPYLDTLDEGLLRLQEDGIIQELYNKWWKVSGSCEKK